MNAVAFLKNRYVTTLSILKLIKERATQHNNKQTNKEQQKNKTQASTKPSKKTKVVFLCQYVPAWNKLEPTYRRLKETENVETILLCVSDDTINYYKENGYDNVIDASKVAFKDLKADYVFCCRPYDYYLPKELSSKELCKYSKICFIHYGSSMVYETLPITLNRGFMSRVSYFFADDEEIRKYNEKQNKLGHFLKLQKSYCLGIPGTEILYQKSKQERAKNSKIEILWTPRWSTGADVGGSHFFDYKDELLKFIKDNKDKYSLTIRPHPLMFDNFLKTGEMTQTQIDEFKQQCKELNVTIDQSKDYTDTFLKTDILISDASSIVTEFFVLNKPLIYCPAPNQGTFLPYADAIINNCYITKTFDEIEKTIKELETEDKQYNARKQVIETVLIKNNKLPSENIVNTILGGSK